jgi:hypothetical protein
MIIFNDVRECMMTCRVLLCVDLWCDVLLCAAVCIVIVCCDERCCAVLT